MDINKLPPEFDTIRTGRGYTMAGWDFTRAQIAEAIKNGKMLNPAMELGTNYCPWNCSFCFTEDPSNPEGEKRRLKDEMDLKRKLLLIDEAAALGVQSINIVGAGEPTIDPHFFTLLERMRRHLITPIVYTEASLRLRDRDFVDKLYYLNATVVVKVNSLENEDYQNAIVAGDGKRKRRHAGDYTKERNKALDLLMEYGFNDSDPTQLAFDTIICEQNKHEIEDIHRYARQNNIFVLFVNYLPSGRSSDGLHGAISREEQFKIFERLAEIDRKEFGIEHRSCFPYAGGTPCSIRGMGLFVKITGKVYDCPGEMMELGNVQTDTLREVWNRARPITEAFDGGCAPREQFWRSHGQLAIEQPR